MRDQEPRKCRKSPESQRRVVPPLPSLNAPVRALTAISHAHMALGNFEEAVHWAERSHVINAEDDPTFWMLIAGNAQLGRMPEARKWLAGFVAPGGYAPGLRLLGQLCEPVLKPVRRVIPPIGQIDFSVLWVSIAIGALLILLR